MTISSPHPSISSPAIPNSTTTTTTTSSTFPFYPAHPVTVIFPSPDDFKPIATERLILQPIRPSNNQDAEGLFRIRSREDVMNWLRFQPPDATPSDTKSWLRSKIFATPGAAGNVGDRHFYFTVRTKQNPGIIIGAVGVNSLLPAPSIGYAFHPDSWGQGFASGAVKGVVVAWWGLDRAELPKGEKQRECEEELLYSGESVENGSSRRVLEKARFSVYATLEVEGSGRNVFLRMTRPLQV